MSGLLPFAMAGNLSKGHFVTDNMCGNGFTLALLTGLAIVNCASDFT
jgi:hypothetical protein